MRVTQMNANSKNKIHGQRITVYATTNGVETIVDRFSVTSMFGAVRYCQKHTSGVYGTRYSAAISRAIEIENN